MAANVEEFLIELGFADKKAVKGIRDFLNKVDSLNKKISRSSTKSANEMTKAHAKQAEMAKANIQDQNKLIKDQNKLKEEGLKKETAAAKAAKERQKLAEQQRRKRDQQRRDMGLARVEFSDPFRNILKNNAQQARALKRAIKSAIDEGDIREVARLKAEIRELSRAYTRAAAEAKKLQFVQRGLGDSTRNMVRSYISLFAIFQGTGAINRVGQDFESMRASMLAVTGTSEKAAQEMAFIDKEAVRLGLSLKDTTKAYIKLLAGVRDKATLEETREIFLGITEASTVLGLTTEETTRAIRAVVQMFGKGGIRAEELRQQLGEVLPVAMGALERATGKTSEEITKMLEVGALGLDVLPEFGRELRAVASNGGALEKVLQTTRVQQNRFITASQKASNVIFKGGFGEGLQNLFNSLTGGMESSNTALTAFGKIFKAVFDGLAFAFRIFKPVLDTVFFVTGNLVDMVNSFLSTTSGKLIATIGTITLGFSRLGKTIASVLGLSALLNPWVVGLTTVFALLDEVFSLFTRGRVGILEKAIGRDIASLDELRTELENLDLSVISDKISKTLTDAFKNIEWSEVLLEWAKGISAIITFFPKQLFGPLASNPVTDFFGNLGFGYDENFERVRAPLIGSTTLSSPNQTPTGGTRVIQNSPSMTVEINGSGLSQEQLEMAISNTVPPMVEKMNKDMFTNSLLQGY